MVRGLELPLGASHARGSAQWPGPSRQLLERRCKQGMLQRAKREESASGLGAVGCATFWDCKGGWRWHFPTAIADRLCTNAHTRVELELVARRRVPS